MATLRLGSRVVIGAQKQRDVLWLQCLAHHVHQVLAQPVQVGLLAQPLAQNAARVFATSALSTLK